jgi:hypothetical protein
VKFRHLGYFLHNQFSPKQAVSTYGLFKGFKSSLMWMFWAFKLSFDVEISVFWATFFQTLGENCITFSGHTGSDETF